MIFNLSDGGSSTAEQLKYDNSKSGLESDNVQGAVDELNDSLTASDNLKFQFATDGEGNYGYLGADDSFIPFKQGGFNGFCLAEGTDGGKYILYSTDESICYLSGKYENGKFVFYATFGKAGVFKVANSDSGATNNKYQLGEFIEHNITEPSTLNLVSMPYGSNRLAVVLW